MNPWVVIGGGIAGVSAALSLKEKGKTPILLRRSGGATMVSSGAIDFGPMGEGSWASHRDRWEETCSHVLKRGGVAVADLDEGRNLLSAWPELDFREEPFRIPTLFGTWKSVFGAQKPISLSDAATLRGKRVAFVFGPHWRVDGESLVRRWKESFPEVDLFSLPLEEDLVGPDCSLSHVATRIECEPDALFEKLSPLKGKADHFLFPPLFLSLENWETASALLQAPVSEALSSTTPVAGWRWQRMIEKRIADIESYDVDEIAFEATGRMISEIRARWTPSREMVALKPEGIILATGKIFGGGIEMGFERVREPLLELPVFQNAETPVEFRSQLPAPERKFLEPQSWAAIGLSVDELYRPLDRLGQPVWENVKACGSLLGGVDLASSRLGLGFSSVTGRACGLSVG